MQIKRFVLLTISRGDFSTSNFDADLLLLFLLDIMRELATRLSRPGESGKTLKT